MKKFNNFFSNILLVVQKLSNQTKSNLVDEKAYSNIFQIYCWSHKNYQIKPNQIWWMKKIIKFFFKYIVGSAKIIKPNQIKFGG